MVIALDALQGMGIDFPSLISYKIGEGNITLFWINRGGNFASRFPLIFELDKRKFCFISNQVSLHGVEWVWKIKPNFPVFRQSNKIWINLAVGLTILPSLRVYMSGHLISLVMEISTFIISDTLLIQNL